MNSLWDIRIFLGLVPKESHCITNIEGEQSLFVQHNRDVSVCKSG